MSETLVPPEDNRTETHLLPNPTENSVPRGPAPRMIAGDSQLLAPRSRTRELFPSSWLRSPAKVAMADGELEGALLDYCSTGLIMQAKGRKRTRTTPRLRPVSTRPWAWTAPHSAALTRYARCTTGQKEPTPHEQQPA